MIGLITRTALVFLCVTCASDAVGASRPEAPAQARATEGDVLRKFQAQIDTYMELHNRLEKESRARGPADSPEQLRASQKALATKILATRKNARQGDIFFPEVRTVFRARLRRVLEGPNAAELKKSMRGPTRMLWRVHAEYPEGWPVATVPPPVLAVLPKLPEDLEFRFVGTTMILRDVHANLIVDYFAKAIR